MRILLAPLFTATIFFATGFGQEPRMAARCSADEDEVIAKPTRLSQPIYPPAAKAVRATGDVVVFVTVNREGKVETASAQEGHPLLRKVSETAASDTTFEPAKTACQRVATLTFTFLTGPPELDVQAVESTFHTQILAFERRNRKTVGDKDPCKELRFMALGGEAPTLSIKEALQFPECVEGKLIRVYGIYRVAFENSDFYDATGTGSSWLEFGPYYSVTKKCGSPEALKTLDSKNGGTFGLIALGILRTGGGFGYGHMNGWDSEFQMMCVEDAKKFYKNGFVFSSLPLDVQKQVVNWYEKRH